MFDPLDPSVIADPYPHYAALRRDAPVLWLPDDDIWVVSRYRDIVALLRDTESFSSRLGMAAAHDGADRRQSGVHFRIGAPGVRVLIALDPPEHPVFRRAVMGAFAARGIARLREGVNRIAREQVGVLLERARAGDADFYRDVAEPVPALVLAELFGLPVEMRENLRQWAQVITADLAATPPSGDVLGRGLGMLRYFRKEMARRRGGTGESLLDILANGHAHGLTDREILSFCGFLVVAGVETTTNQLTNLLDVLVRQPQVQARLRADPGLIPAAVEEGLRYDTSVQALWRSTTRETTLAGRVLPPDARIFVLFGSANRDPEHFPHPDRFLLDRKPNDHLSFGHGIHYCLGARLGRLEMEAVVRELLARTVLVEGGESTRIQSVALRGFSRQALNLVPVPDAAGRPPAPGTGGARDASPAERVT